MGAALLTYADAIDLLVDFTVGQGAQATQLTIRRAIEAAYQEVCQAHRWTFLTRNGRIFLRARQEFSQVAYDHTGGTYERMLTLADPGKSWPAWAEDASVRIGDVICDVDERISDTVLVLSATMNPGRDIPSGGCVLWPRYYRLPSDFLSFTGPMAESYWRLGVPVTMTEMLAQDRYHTESGAIQFYSVAEVPDVYGRQALFVYPAAVADETLDYVYVRRPRELRYSGHDAAEYTGTITLTAGSDVVLGTGTRFSAEIVGSILRIGTDANRPTGRFGEHPFAEERSVASVESATQLTLDAGAAATRSGVGYAITDVIDLGRVAHTAFLRLAEMHVAIGRNLKSLGAIRELADRALLEAMAADNPVACDPASDAPYPIVTLPQGEVRF